MNEKFTTQTTAEPISQRNRSTNPPNVSQGPPALNSPFALAQTIGNQAILDLLAAGTIQAKLRVSQPGDPDEQEADHIAGKIVAAAHAPKIHRKCACESSGTPCAKCQDEETTIHRSAATTVQLSSPLSIQRAPAASDSAATPDKVAGTPSRPSPTPSKTHPLVVEDDAQSVAPHQMRKSAFIGLLRSDACTAADAILKSVGHTTESCPYIAKWLAFYEKQSSEHIERAILKYAPETAAARSAHQAIRLVVVRVERATLTWAKTGKISGLPDDLAAQIPGQGFFGAIQKFASSGIGGAILGFIGGRKPEKSAEESPHESKNTGGPTVSRKANSEGSAAPARDASAVRSQLGSGHSLDSRVQSQMATAFHHDFSSVRVHTDSSATKLSSDLNARAFTIGQDVAFASGEYQPGTPIGDALIAHELAHVVQQSGGRESVATKAHDAGVNDIGSLEQDANRSAIDAVWSTWSRVKGAAGQVGSNALPRLRSGLRLQRCAHHSQTPVKTPKMPATPGAVTTPAAAPAAAPVPSEPAASPAPGGNMAHKPLSDADKAKITGKFKDATAPSGAAAAFRDGPRFVLHDTGMRPTGAGKTPAEKATNLEKTELARIAEHKKVGGTPVGEGPSAYTTALGTPGVAHPKFFEADRPTATEFERGNDLMEKKTRETLMQNAWNLTDPKVQKAAVASYLSAFTLDPKDVAKETAKASQNLDPKLSKPTNETASVVFTTAGGAVAGICNSVATAKSASAIAIKGKERDLETVCGSLNPVFNTRRERIAASTNLEISAEEGSDCRTKGPTKPFPGYPAATFDAVAKLYLLAALEIGQFPEITTHFFLDAKPITKSINRCDPRCWNLPLLYSLIATIVGHPPGTTYGVDFKPGVDWGVSTVWWFDPVCGTKPAAAGAAAPAQAPPAPAAPSPAPANVPLHNS